MFLFESSSFRSICSDRALYDINSFWKFSY